MKLKDEIKKSDPVNETPSTFIAADGSVQENLGSKVRRRKRHGKKVGVHGVDTVPSGST